MGQLVSPGAIGSLIVLQPPPASKGSHMRAAILPLCLLALLSLPASGGDWPAFRGPTGTGIAEGESGLPVEWSAEKNVKWKTPLPADGNSSPIVVAGKVFVTCPEQDGRQR